MCDHIRFPAASTGRLKAVRSPGGTAQMTLDRPTVIRSGAGRTRKVAAIVAAPALFLGLSISAVPAVDRNAGVANAAIPSGIPLRFTASGDISSTVAAQSVLSAIDIIDPDLHLALGDLSYGTTGNEQAWCDLVTARVGAGFPFELFAGNHESNGLNGNINDFSACLPNQLPGLVGTYGRQYYVDVPAGAPLVRSIMISPNPNFAGSTWS